MFLNDEELVNRAKADDQRAIEELIHRYHPKAYAIAYQLCAEEGGEVLDITQEAFFKAIKNIKKFRGEASFATWFYRIVVNTCRDFLRQRRKKEQLFLFWPWKKPDNEKTRDLVEEQPDSRTASNPMRVVTGKELHHEVRKALRSLPEKQRMVFQLKVLHEMSIREIAQLMGASEGSVKSHLFRATHSLRHSLKNWGVP